MSKKIAKLLPSIGFGMLLITGLQSCSTINKMVRSEGGRALVCGGGGALTGAIVFYGCDALTGKRGACIAGAAAVALADGINCWWQLSQKIVDDYDATLKTLHYDPSQKTIVKILGFDADKKVVHPGEEIKVHMQYALMSPNSTEEIKIEQTLALPGDNKPRIEVITRQPGTWGTDQDYSVKIDPATPEGKTEIILELKLVDQHSKQDHDRRTFCFVVTHGNSPSPAQSCGSNHDSTATIGTYYLKKKSKVFSEPSGKADGIAQARSGESFTVIEKKKQKSGSWYKIKLEDGREGWLPANAGTLKKD